ncbi:hypothetical protein B0T18DRAFT_449625 [Schizothecium vesticola]|uniref:Uncharacterized protein n=1 Tax=Schizothecium vesticola TaxID=314040 RepID=A0AA40K0C6_9PEZI|nr:hypothetical protein B0T18DRAFT_449625 [Schizothecium vesticola]
MVGINQRMPSRGPSRIAYPGLRLRSYNLTEPPPSQVKAQGIASSDWRKKTTTTSSESMSARSLQTSSETRSRKEGTGSSEMPPYSMEKEDMPERAIRYRPKPDQAAWELVVSAPAGRAPGSPSSTSSQGQDGMMRVMFKDMKPMTMNFGGEEIVLSNSFTFDLVPEPLPSSSSGGSETRGTVGVLRPVRNLRGRQRLSSSTESVWNYLPGDLHGMLENSRLLALNSAGGLKGQAVEAPDEECEDRKGKRRAHDRRSDSGYGDEAASSWHAGTQVDESEKRFFDMLDRLHKPDPALQRCDKPRPEADAEIGTGEKFQERDAEASLQPRVHFANANVHHQGAWARRAAQESSSGDSGYQSGDSVPVRHELPDISPSTMEGFKAPPSSPQEKNDDEGETHQSIPKRLNPAAAEFKAQTAPLEFEQPRISSQKLARMPLTNFVPGAVQDSTSSVFSKLPPPVPSHAPGTVQSQQSPNFGFPSIPPGFEGTFSKPPGLPNARTTHLGDATAVTPFDQRLPGAPQLGEASLAPTNPGPYVPNFGFPPSFSLLQLQASMGQLNTDPFNIFSHMNLSALGSIPSLGPNLRGPMPAAPIPPVAPQPPILGLDPKVHRPTFPVTQKPRDRDPIKQQLYEQYLEWRKANEPGYHQACKIRQAQRVVRQYIQKHHAEKTEDEETKTMVEKTVVENAKAMIRAAAAEAAAEKQRKIDEVREGFKAKVRERTKGLGLSLGENTKPEPEHGEGGIEVGA